MSELISLAELTEEERKYVLINIKLSNHTLIIKEL